MSKKKKILIILVSISLVISLITLGLVLFLPKDKKMTEEQWTSRLTEFDNLNSVTYQIEKDGIEVVLQNSKIKYQNKNDETYYEFENDIIYRYFKEDGTWYKEKYYEEIPCITLFNLSQFISAYSSFDTKDEELYYAKDITINGHTYLSVNIGFEGEKLRTFSYKTTDVDIEYYFMKHNNSVVSYPQRYYFIHGQLLNTEWEKLVDNSSNVTNFTLSSTYEDKIGEEIYLRYAQISKYNEKEVLIENSSDTLDTTTYSIITHGVITNYQLDNNSWVQTGISQTEMVNYSQKDTLPLNLIKSNYEQLEFNAIGNTYTLKDITYDNCYYNSVVIIIEDGYISYIELKYTYESDGKTHTVNKILEYSNFKSTVVDVNI